MPKRKMSPEEYERRLESNRSKTKGLKKSSGFKDKSKRGDVQKLVNEFNEAFEKRRIARGEKKPKFNL